MGLALGIDYSLFVLSRYREERHNGLAKNDAIVASGRHGQQGGPVQRQLVRRGAVRAAAGAGHDPAQPGVRRDPGRDRDRGGRARPCSRRCWRCSATGSTRCGCRTSAASRPAESPFWTRAVGVVVRRPVTALVGERALPAPAGRCPCSTCAPATPASARCRTAPSPRRGSWRSSAASPAASADPAQVVVAGDVGSPEAEAALARLETSLAADSAFGPPASELAPGGDVAVVSIPVRGDPNSDLARAAVERLRSDLVPDALDGHRSHRLRRRRDGGEHRLHGPDQQVAADRAGVRARRQPDPAHGAVPLARAGRHRGGAQPAVGGRRLRPAGAGVPEGLRHRAARASSRSNGSRPGSRCSCSRCCSRCRWTTTSS